MFLASHVYDLPHACGIYVRGYSFIESSEDGVNGSCLFLRDRAFVQQAHEGTLAF